MVSRLIALAVSIDDPPPTATNYFEWSLIMKVNMEAQRVWDAIEGGGTFSQDRAALAAIL